MRDTTPIATPPPGETVFRARGLTKIYDMGEVQVHALRGVDVDLFAGELVVLLGPSGSGKSTLLNILGGLDTSTGGEVSYRGRDLTRATEKELTEYRRHHVGFVFQFYNLIPSLTAQENVAAVTDIAEEPMRPGDALAMVGLGERLNHFPAQLSGGEQQRVAIARAIAKNPGPRFLHGHPGARGPGTHQPGAGNDHGGHHAQRGHRPHGRSGHPPELGQHRRNIPEPRQETSEGPPLVKR